MTTELRLVEMPDNWYDTEVGDIWPCPNHSNVHTIEGRGPCWVVRLRDTYWHTNMTANDDTYWTVTGEAPKITVNPSIHVSPPTGWHGWIEDGVMRDA